MHSPVGVGKPPLDPPVGVGKPPLDSRVGVGKPPLDSPVGVGKPPLDKSATGNRRGLLEGWPVAAVVLFVAGAPMLVALPRAVEPVELPLPTVDAGALAAAQTADARLADEARRGLDVDVRALGTEVRAFGRVDAFGEQKELAPARAKVAAAAKVAVGQGMGPLLALRAFQLEAFVREVRRFEDTGEESEELVELGGAFVSLLKRSGWVEQATGKKSRVLVPPAVLAVLFKRRWNEVTTLDGERFAPTRDEQRALYAFLLQRPPRQPTAGVDPPAEPTPFERAQQDDLRLKKIDELAALDSSYPASLARAVIHHRRGRWNKAADELRKQLEASPDGPWTLRVRNHLQAVLERSAAGTDAP